MKSPLRCCVVMAGFLCWASLAVAQNAVVSDASNYNLADPISFAEPDAGFRFMADALIWARTTPGNGLPVIAGPQSFSFNSLSGSSNYVGGYRLGGAWLIDPNYEVEGVWTSFANWNSSSSGVLTRAVAFNGGVNSPLVDPGGTANAINTGTYFRPIFDAAMDPLANPAIQNYAFLRPGSTFALFSTSTLYDVQANFKTRRSAYNPYSFGIGYRNIRLSEGAATQISGVFGTNDLPAGGTTFNILQNDALTAHGLTILNGAADGFTNNLVGPPTTLSLLWNGSATNQLNGFQGTFDGSFFERGIFALETVVRAGVFFNHITGSVREVYAAGGADNSVYGRSFSDDKDVVSFAGNFGLNALFSFSQHVKFRTGYELMLLTNVASAANQQGGIAYNSLGMATYSVQGGSTVLFHGFRAGLEFVW